MRCLCLDELVVSTWWGLWIVVRLEFVSVHCLLRCMFLVVAACLVSARFSMCGYLLLWTGSCYEWVCYDIVVVCACSCLVLHVLLFSLALVAFCCSLSIFYLVSLGVGSACFLVCDHLLHVIWCWLVSVCIVFFALCICYICEQGCCCPGGVQSLLFIEWSCLSPSLQVFVARCVGDWLLFYSMANRVVVVVLVLVMCLNFAMFFVVVVCSLSCLKVSLCSIVFWLVVCIVCCGVVSVCVLLIAVGMNCSLCWCSSYRWMLVPHVLDIASCCCCFWACDFCYHILVIVGCSWGLLGVVCLMYVMAVWKWCAVVLGM